MGTLWGQCQPTPEWEEASPLLPLPELPLGIDSTF